MKLSKNDIDKIRKVFTGQPVKKAYLFGSYSRGEAQKNSDVDILVELNYSEHIGLGFLRMKNDLEQALQKSVDLVSENGLSRHVLPFVNADKLLIYEK